MKFHPVLLFIRIYHAERVTAETMHMPIGIGNTSIAHGYGNLMKRFGQRSPKIPVVASASQINSRISFDGVIKVGKFKESLRKNTGVLLPTKSQFPSPYKT